MDHVALGADGAFLGGAEIEAVDAHVLAPPGRAQVLVAAVHDVATEPADEDVVAVVGTEQRVVAGPGIDDTAPARDIEQVVAIGADRRGAAAAAGIDIQRLDTGVAAQILAGGGADGVVAGSVDDGVAGIVADEIGVVARPAFEPIDPGAADQPVIAVAALEEILALHADQRVVGIAGDEVIAAGGADQGIPAIGAGDHLVEAGIFDFIGKIGRRTRHRRLQSRAVRQTVSRCRCGRRCRNSIAALRALHLWPGGRQLSGV